MPLPPPVGICGLTLKPSWGVFCSIPLFFFSCPFSLSLATYFSLSPEPLFVSVCVCLPTRPPAHQSLSVSLPHSVGYGAEDVLWQGCKQGKSFKKRTAPDKGRQRQCALNHQPCVQGNVRGNHGFCLEHAWILFSKSLAKLFFFLRTESGQPTREHNALACSAPPALQPRRHR